VARSANGERERKRIFRALIEDVTLLCARAIQIAIRWKGGATTTVERPVPLDAPDLRRTPAAIVEMIRGLATEQTDRQVVETLNRRWLRSGTGQPFRRLVVRHIRNAYEGLLRAVRADDKGLLLFEPRPAHFLAPNRARDSATVAAIPNVGHTRGKRCSMKPEPSAKAIEAPY
jgi:hypothetical protein